MSRRCARYFLSALPPAFASGLAAPLASPFAASAPASASGATCAVAGTSPAGVAVSAGAACASGSVEPSHVLVAMGLTRAEARGALRFSVGHETDESQIDAVLALLPDLVARARAAGVA